MTNRARCAATIACLLVGACIARDATAPKQHDVSLLLRADLSGTAAATLVIIVTAPDIANSLVFNAPVVDGIASATVTLPAGGSRTLTLHAYDASGTETHRGSATVDVRAGTNPAVDLVLFPLAGDVPITVTLGSVLITIAPTAYTLPRVGTGDLTATVVDARGAELSEPVLWATLNPRVATITATGDRTARVTAVGAGSTNVVGTVGGSAATVTIAVPAAVPVFPGAEGYGTTTPAGRGGQLIHVTTLDDAGPGSLREALTAVGPRTVVFDVSGYIRLESDIEIGDIEVHDRDFLTVAGQTAPSPGITIIGGLIVRASDVLIQHIRIRPGVAGKSERRDALSIEGPLRRVVIDHVSVSWAGNTGKNMSISGEGGARDVTISDCIDAEAFPYGLLVFDDSKRIAVLRTLFAHNFDRNPEVASNTSVTFVNNLIYNPGGIQNGEPRFFFGVWRGQAVGTPPNGPAYANVLGIVAKAGPTSGDLRLEFHQNALPGSDVYLADNVVPDGVLFASGTGFAAVGSPPFPLPAPLTVLASGEVESYVLANAGARPLDRDAVDVRVIGDVTAGTGNSMLDDETQVGGFPALAENTRVLAIPPDYATIRASGYSVLEEEILFPLARAVGRP